MANLDVHPGMNGKTPAYECLEMPLGQVDLDANVRPIVEDEAFDQLVRSLASQGQLQHCAAYWNERRDRAVLISGYRRFHAAKKAGLSHLKVMVLSQAPSPEERRYLQLIENLHRKDLSTLEQGYAYRDLLEQSGMSARELGEKLCVAHTTITRAVELTRLRAEVQAALEEEGLSAAHGHELYRLQEERPEQLESVFEEVRTRHLTAERTAALVSSKLAPRKKGGRGPKATKQRYTLTGGFVAVVKPSGVVIGGKAKGKRPHGNLIDALEALLARLREDLPPLPGPALAAPEPSPS